MRTKPIGEHHTPLTGLRVLVVEDDYSIADEICSSLREHGSGIVGMPGEFSGCVRLAKPVNLRVLLRAVQSACAGKLALQEG